MVLTERVSQVAKNICTNYVHIVLDYLTVDERISLGIEYSFEHYFGLYVSVLAELLEVKQYDYILAQSYARTNIIKVLRNSIDAPSLKFAIKHGEAVFNTCKLLMTITEKELRVQDGD